MVRVSTTGETVTQQSLPRDPCSAKTLVRQGGPGTESSVQDGIYVSSMWGGLLARAGPISCTYGST